MKRTKIGMANPRAGVTGVATPPPSPRLGTMQKEYTRFGDETQAEARARGEAEDARQARRARRAGGGPRSTPRGMKNGGSPKKMKKGGKLTSRGAGCEIRG
jgi:hypothetical protein